MRKRLLTGAAALLLAFPAFAQEVPFPKTFSLEAGTGIAPAHTLLLAPSWETKRALAENGQEEDGNRRYPSVSLSGVWRVKPRTEYVLCAGLSWCNYQVVQHDVFGTDPSGKPRYAAWEAGTPVGRKNAFIPSLTFRYRHLWNPDKTVVAYSGAGLGWTLSTSLLPLPDLTPVGFRLQRGPFRVFVECTVSPVATLAHGGLGWTF